MPHLVAFRRLVVVTAGFAYTQVALGGIVRVSGSGLGCPDWPLCQGQPYPPANVHAIIEYSHRTVGTITGILLIATVAAAWWLFRQRRPSLAWLATSALALVVLEGAVGGVVVIKELAPWLVLVHLAIALLILGLLALTAIRTLAPSPSPDIRFRRLAVGGVAATYVLLLTGSSVVASGADEGCHSWPLCGGGLQLSFAGADAFTMLHRFSAGLGAIFVAYLLVTAFIRWRSVAGVRPMAVITLAALVAQLAVGAAAALTDTGVANGLHVALGSAVWLGVAALAALSFPRPAPDMPPQPATLALERSAA